MRRVLVGKLIIAPVYKKFHDNSTIFTDDIIEMVSIEYPLPPILPEVDRSIVAHELIAVHVCTNIDEDSLLRVKSIDQISAIMIGIEKWTGDFILQDKIDCFDREVGVSLFQLLIVKQRENHCE